MTPKLVAALQTSPVLSDVSSDQQNTALESNLVIDRDTASRLWHHGQPDRQHTL